MGGWVLGEYIYIYRQARKYIPKKGISVVIDNIYMYVHVRPCVHTYIHTHTHIHTHIQEVGKPINKNIYVYQSTCTNYFAILL